MIYKIVPFSLWRDAKTSGAFVGAPVDIADGFMHFSARDQVEATAAKHFAGEGDLLLVAVEEKALGAALKWEASRGGALFPHLYAPLRLEEVAWVEPLPLDADGRHDFTCLLP